MNQEIRCGGGCEHYDGHEGPVREVIVSGNGWPETEFDYCNAAIARDVAKGFTVNPKPEAR